jgi:hypothetical protein
MPVNYKSKKSEIFWGLPYSPQHPLSNETEPA